MQPLTQLRQHGPLHKYLSSVRNQGRNDATFQVFCLELVPILFQQ